MAKCSLLFLYFFQGLLPLIFGQQQQQQQRTAGLWRQRVQWQNNGQVYSLMTTGSEYQAPVRSRSQSRVYVTSRRDGTRSQMPSRGTTFVRAGQAESSPGSTAPGQPVGYVPFSGRASGSRQQQPGARHLNPEHSNTIDSSARRVANVDATALHTRGGEPGPGAQYLVRESEVPTPGEEVSNEEMVNDDPRNPLKNHRNSVLYNPYPGRSVARRPPGTGYGTRYFQNGLPDLVPDPYAIQAGAYVQRMQMYALRCAAEENCLARSAYGPAVRDIDFRVLLRFPQKVKNQGTTDFLPVKPRYQWDWHSCHQHYHSMDAFSNYDLLDVVTGRKVAEGHKASFCLEDTSCDPGFRRRYACTSHTQGLSPGCHDVYAANIDCQWIDITDVPPGNYILKVTVNPNFHVMESDFSNNIVRCDITYTGVYVQTHHCRVTRG